MLLEIFRFSFSVIFSYLVMLGIERLQRNKQKSLQRIEAINVINGIVLPEPDDPRWIVSTDCYRLGGVEVYTDHICFIEDKSLKLGMVKKEYVIAIRNTIMSRIAEDSILNAKMPPKVKTAKRITKSDIQAMIPAVEKTIHKTKISKGYCLEKDCWKWRGPIEGTKFCIDHEPPSAQVEVKALEPVYERKRYGLWY